jgi:DNA-binding GntR family transcriptional regulator
VVQRLTFQISDNGKAVNPVARPDGAEPIDPAKIRRDALPPAPTRVAAPSAAGVAAEYIRTLIFEGVLREGDRVSYDEIAEQLDMSRQPVREAIIELERDGVTVSKPQRGTFVGEFNQRTVLEHHAVYGLLEGYAARQVAIARDPKVVAKLRDLWRRTKAATSPEERDINAIRFLSVIDTEGSDSRLKALLQQISQFVPKSYYREHVPDATGAARLKRVLVAIEKGDPDAAAAAVVKLWKEAGDLLVEHLYEAGVFQRDRTE